MDVAKALGASGTQARVVSMPCWELFEQQDEAYQLQGTGTLLLSIYTIVPAAYCCCLLCFRRRFLAVFLSTRLLSGLHRF